MCLLHLSWASRDQTTFCRTFESYVGALSDHWLKTRSTGADVAGTLKIFSSKGRKTVSFVSLVNSRTLSTRPRPRTIEIVLDDPRGQGHVLEDSITGLTTALSEVAVFSTTSTHKQKLWRGTSILLVVSILPHILEEPVLASTPCLKRPSSVHSSKRVFF